MSNVLTDIADDFCDFVGIHRMDEFFHPPAGFIRGLGLWAFKDVVPSPRQLAEKGGMVDMGPSSAPALLAPAPITKVIGNPPFPPLPPWPGSR